MFASLVYFSLLQVACAAAINQPRSGTIGARLQKRGVATGSIVAIAVCVPAAALVVGLGIFIFVLYPSQQRKWKAEQVRLAELKLGRDAHQAAPPPYNAQEGSTAVTNEPRTEETNAPNYTSQPQTNAPPTEAANSQARHAALMSF